MIQLQFRTPAENWVLNLCRGGQVSVKILSLKAQTGDGEITHFVDISSNQDDAGQLSETILKSSDVVASDVARVGGNRLVGAVTSNGCVVCSAIINTTLGYFIGPAISEENCQMNYKLFMNGEGIPSFLQSLHTKGIIYKIADITKIAPKKTLTTRQERVLKSAFELGYYDYPKKVSTEELSHSLNIAASTVAEILRRAERRIIGGYFENN